MFEGVGTYARLPERGVSQSTNSGSFR